MAEFDIRHGARHLSDLNNSSLYQPVRTNNFEMVVDFSGIELYKPGKNVNDEASKIKNKNAQEVINFSVVKFTPPHFSQEEIEVKRGNSKVYFASVPTWEAKDLVINDFIGADGKSILLAWQRCSYDVENDTIPSSDKYKVNAYVNEYLPDNTLVRYWELKGCWVKSLNETEWDNESANKKTITANIRYDVAIPHLPD